MTAEPSQPETATTCRLCGLTDGLWVTYVPGLGRHHDYAPLGFDGSLLLRYGGNPSVQQVRLGDGGVCQWCNESGGACTPLATNLSSTKPTLGPWHVEAPPIADNGNPWRVADEAHQTIAIVTKFPPERYARLIAAMPGTLNALRIAELHLSISDDTCADRTPDGNRCRECLGCSVDMARNEVRKALTEAGSGPL